MTPAFNECSERDIPLRDLERQGREEEGGGEGEMGEEGERRGRRGRRNKQRMLVSRHRQIVPVTIFSR